MWRGPRVQCFFEATRVRWSPTADVAWPPRICAFARLRGSLREVRIWCYLLSDGVWFCIGTSVMGPAWRSPFWCGAVFFPRFSVDGRSQREFGGGFLRVYVGGRRAPYCCLSFWLCSLFFLYVVFHDYLLIFIPSLSMKWAPSCAGSFKKKHGVQVKIMRFTSFTIKRLITSEQDTIRSLICYYIYSMCSNFKQPPQSLYDKFVSCVSKD